MTAPDDRAPLERALRAAEADLERQATERLALAEAAAAARTREAVAARTLERALARIGELEGALARLEGSRAWRVMALLWRAGRWLPRRRRPGPPPSPAPASVAPPPEPWPWYLVAGAPPPPPLVHAPRRLTPRALRVCFVTADRGFVSHRHRVAHYAAYLDAAGVDALVVDHGELEAVLPHLPLWDVVVLFRAQASPLVDRLLDACRRAGVLVAYDVDDLVFDPLAADASRVDALRTLPAVALVDAMAQPARFRDVLARADLCTVTTAYLAERCRALGVPAQVLSNGLEPGPPPPAVERPADALRLGFFSGTATHQRDFAVVVPALAHVLQAHPHVRLRVVGALGLREFPELDTFALRIEQRPLVPPDALAAEIAGVDVLLAPLEPGNPFCEAKSALKWVQAAAVGVPVVASATAGFREAVRHGETGFLAATTADWIAALERLIADDALRAAVGAAAREAAARELAPAVLGRRARETYAAAIRARTPADDALAVTLLLEATGAAGPLPRRTLVLAEALARRGHEVRVAVLGDSAAVERSFAALRDDGWIRHLRFAGGPCDLPCSDVLLATTAATAAVVPALSRRAARLVALGVPAPAASGVTPVAWRLPGATPDGVPVFLEPGRWDGDPARAGRDWVVCALPPAADDAAGALALAALAPVPLGEAQAVALVGRAHDGGPARLGRPHHDLGWQPAAALATVLRRAAVGVALTSDAAATTGLAMLACGCPVVALDTPAARALYGGTGHARLVDADAAAVAGAVRGLLDDPGAATALATAGQRWARGLATPDDAAADFERLLRAALAPAR